MALTFRIGPDVISNYRRLAYTPWHALAEFVDNSTQALENDKMALTDLLAREGDKLEVSITYDKDSARILVYDNSSGMNYEELERAMHVGHRPDNPHGRCRYGMGMKTAACWLGDFWTVRTKRHGQTTEYEVEVDVRKIASGDIQIPIREHKDQPLEAHHTYIEISALHRTFKGRTIGKIRDYLRSMYRADFRRGTLRLMWNGEELAWEDLDTQLLRDPDGSLYKKPFEFRVDSKPVSGWVGILSKGSRAKAGFSIMHCDRVIRGWPDSWRPSSLYGQIQGSNDLVNQRLVGEINLSEFEVSHTKDDILWVGEEEEKVEEEMLKWCGAYRQIAKTHRKGVDERGPSSLETNVAVAELEKELLSPEVVDVIQLEPKVPPDVIRAAFKSVLDSERGREPRFKATLCGIHVKGYLMSDRSESDPYFVCDSTQESEVIIVINQSHPHWTQLRGSAGVLNYLRHCTYDALAEHQARHKTSKLDPDTIKMLKDRFLRVPLQMEMHGTDIEEVELPPGEA